MKTEMLDLNEIIKSTKKDLSIFKKCKEFLDQYLIDKKDFVPLIPEMYEAIVKTDLPIMFYTNHTLYTRDGIKECRSERYFYPVYIELADGSVYYYSNGNYDIEEDIKIEENVLASFEAELAELERS